MPWRLNCGPFALQVQQQAALMASVGQGGYLSPMAAFAAAQMQHMATINGLPGAPLTPTSGNAQQEQRHPLPSQTFDQPPESDCTFGAVSNQNVEVQF